MRIIKVILLLAFFSFLSNEVHTIIRPGVRPEKKPIETKKTNCCILNANYSDNVRLIQICQTKNSTIIYMDLQSSANACCYLDKISLVDNNGKSYTPISLHGISNCPKTTFMRARTPFSWEFEKLEKGITSIDIEEDPNSPAPQPGDWNWWKWKNVTVKHCNL